MLLSNCQNYILPIELLVHNSWLDYLPKFQSNIILSCSLMQLLDLTFKVVESKMEPTYLNTNCIQEQHKWPQIPYQYNTNTNTNTIQIQYQYQYNTNTNTIPIPIQYQCQHITKLLTYLNTNCIQEQH